MKRSILHIALVAFFLVVGATPSFAQAQQLARGQLLRGILISQQ